MLDVKGITGSIGAHDFLENLPHFERSEFRGLFNRIKTQGFIEPEALVEINDQKEITLISENMWSLIFITNNKKYNLVIKVKSSELHVESITLEH